MGAISTGIGLISGIDTASLISQLLALEARGKIPLQAKIGSLKAKQLALMDINSRLLNMQTASKSFRADLIFKSTLGTSSNEEILTVSTGKSAQPGTFTFIVKQLVTASQKLSQGYADKNTTPLSLTSLSFEFGKGLVGPDTELVDLNGGAGVDRGKIIITDKNGDEGTIDLTAATSINEVIDAINNSDDVAVTATFSGDGLVITDTSGGGDTLSIESAPGDTTAEDLGIDVAAVGNVITGSDIRTLGGSSTLRSLNDGNGVLIQNNLSDLRITARDTTQFNIDLGRIDKVIEDDTKLSDLNNGDGITIVNGEPDFQVITRNGEIVDIDLGQLLDENDDVTDEAVTTVLELINRVNSQLDAELIPGDLKLEINSDGTGFTLTDIGPGSGTLQVVGAGPKGDDTAQDLGILAIDGGEGDVDGSEDGVITGAIIPNTVQDPAVVTIQDVIDRINNATELGTGDPNTKITAEIDPIDGVSLLITDITGSVLNNLVITGAPGGGPSAAEHLGIEADVAANTVEGDRLIAGLNSVLVRNLNGGAGLSGNTAMSIQDGNGTIEAFDFDETGSLSDIIDLINAPGGVDVTASLNAKGTGLVITNNVDGGFDFDISGVAAAELNITGTVTAAAVGDQITGDNLQVQYVSEAVLLRDLNYGRGVGTGVFRIRDGLGETADVSIKSDSTTLYDIMLEINSRGLEINARINDNGDGLLIEDTAVDNDKNPFVPIKVTSLSGTTAADLNILGEAEDVILSIDGSYEQVVELETGDTLDEIVTKINAANIPVSASVINTGTGATPFHLTLTSLISGRDGELIIDNDPLTEDLGFTTLTQAQDAKVFFGSTDPSDGFLITNDSNTLNSVLQGVTIDLLKASDEAVTITVKRDVNAITEAVANFATTFNDVIGRINDHDFFDVDTEARGVLLGDNTVSQVRDALFRVVQGTTDGVETQYQRLSQVGLTLGKEGVLEFDRTKFDEAYKTDPTAVENLFAAFEATTLTKESIDEFITVEVNKEIITEQGFGELFDRLIERMTNSIDGTVTLADKVFEDQIELTEKRIERFDERLEAKRLRLERQFVAMETALAVLQGQSNALLSLNGNLALAQSFGT